MLCVTYRLEMLETRYRAVRGEATREATGRRQPKPKTMHKDSPVHACKREKEELGTSAMENGVMIWMRERVRLDIMSHVVTSVVLQCICGAPDSRNGEYYAVK